MATAIGGLSLKILVVDDDPDICEFMKTLLEGAGFMVNYVTDPSLVEDRLRDEEEYHIIILDLMMPKIDGIEVLKRIRKIDSDVPVVVFTGYPSVDTAVESLKLDVSDYIKKPFNSDDFLNTIQAVCRKKGYLVDSEQELHSSIGRNIRNLRKKRKLTLKQMARRTGLSVSLLSQIERAESSASVSSLFKVSGALSCRLKDLFGEF